MAQLNYDDYPNLPEFKVDSKRARPAGYNQSELFSGPLFIEQVSDDVPVYWDVSIVCDKQYRAYAFQGWLLSESNGVKIINSGVFTKSIMTEFGPIDHDVRIIGGVPSPTKLSPVLWQYNFRIYAAKLIQPDWAINNPDLPLIYGGQESIIDIAINQEWPTV